VQVFLETFRNQPKAESNEWLAKWCFGEHGACLLTTPAKPEDDQRPKVENAIADLIFERSVIRKPTALSHSRKSHNLKASTELLSAAPGGTGWHKKGLA
jgi:hypothetical protein